LCTLLVNDHARGPARIGVSGTRWGQNFNSPGFRGIGWKIAFVVGDDDLGAALDGRGEHMAILWVVAHSVDERLVSNYPRICEMLSQLAGEIGCLRFGKTDTAFEISKGKDLLRPARQI